MKATNRALAPNELFGGGVGTAVRTEESEEGCQPPLLLRYLVKLAANSIREGADNEIPKL